MATYKTKAIVLSSYPYREHDRIVSFFSKEYGRIESRARGTRKIVSKLAGHIEPYTEVELLLAHGRRWDILAGSRTIEDRRALRTSLEARTAASVCVEAAKLITKPLDPDLRLYASLSDALRLLGDGVDHQDIVHAFLWTALQIAGFSPELAFCINCKNQRPREIHFSCEGGGILCEQCAERDPYATRIERGDLDEVTLKSRTSPAARSVIVSFWNTVVDYTELRSLRVWHQLGTVL